MKYFFFLVNKFHLVRCIFFEQASHRSERDAVTKYEKQSVMKIYYYFRCGLIKFLVRLAPLAAAAAIVYDDNMVKFINVCISGFKCRLLYFIL